MSHFAEVNENNVVIRILVGDNNEIDEGQSFIESMGGTWIKTSYNGTIRKNFAGVDFTYDAVRDAFIAPKPANATGFDEETCRWIVPIPEIKIE